MPQIRKPDQSALEELVEAFEHIAAALKQEIEQFFDSVLVAAESTLEVILFRRIAKEEPEEGTELHAADIQRARLLGPVNPVSRSPP